MNFSLIFKEYYPHPIELDEGFEDALKLMELVEKNS